MKLALLMAMSALTLARADVASFTWTDFGTFQGGTNVANESILFGANLYIARSDGTIKINESCNADLGVYCESGYTLDRTFTVTAPGNFELFSSVNMDLTNFGCSAELGCFNPVTLSINFSETTTILGTSLTQSASGSGSNSAPFQGFPTPVEALASGAGTSIPVFLGIGDYTLEQTYTQNIASSGNAQGNMMGEIGLGPQAVPESKGYLVLLLVGLAIFAKARNLAANEK